VRDRFTGKDRQILVSTAEGVADIRPTAENGTLRGDLKLRKLAVSLHRRSTNTTPIKFINTRFSSAIEIDPNTISQLAPLAKTFLGPELAKGIKKGLPYPLKVRLRINYFPIYF
jgi:hypothetical protein